MPYKNLKLCRSRIECIYNALRDLLVHNEREKGLFLMKEDLFSLQTRIIDLNKHLQDKDIIKDSVCKKRLTEELDRTLYSYYKALLHQMRNMDGNGDGI